MKSTWSILRKMSFNLIPLALLIAPNLAVSGNGWRGGDGGAGVGSESSFDTSFAVEYSYSCLSGGCHDTDLQLVEEYADSFMTHVMVKCNACHGTHTVDEVGDEKPDLTGYYPGIGIIGYQVGDDRCIACHTPTLDKLNHRTKSEGCVTCHTPHRFPARQFGRN